MIAVRTIGPNDKVGIIGLGQMGSGMAFNLLKHHFQVIGFDIRHEALQQLQEWGGISAANIREIVQTCDVIMTSLEGTIYINVAENELVPFARAHQIFVDCSTTPCPQARRIGKLFEEKGAIYLDAPVSGGDQGAREGNLRIFVGGNYEYYQLLKPLFEAIGNPEKIVYCGPIGMGQAAKVVQQLTNRFPDVARMEVMAFGIRAGLPWEVIFRALDVDPQSDHPYAKLYHLIQSGKTQELHGLFSEWKYYLEEIHARGFRLPMLEGMYDFCENAPRIGKDNVGRPVPSIWEELMKYQDSSAPEPLSTSNYQQS